MNGVWYLLVTGTGSGFKHDLTTVPTTRNSWLQCSCFLTSPVYFVPTLSSGFVTKSQRKRFRRVPLLKKSETKTIVDLPQSVQADRPPHRGHKECDGLLYIS